MVLCVCIMNGCVYVYMYVRVRYVKTPWGRKCESRNMLNTFLYVFITKLCVRMYIMYVKTPLGRNWERQSKYVKWLFYMYYESVCVCICVCMCYVCQTRWGRNCERMSKHVKRLFFMYYEIKCVCVCVSVCMCLTGLRKPVWLSCNSLSRLDTFG